MRKREREVRQAFHDASALDPVSARPLSDLGLEESRALSRLERHKIVRESSPGCYYFDEEIWDAVRKNRFRMALMIFAAVVLTLLVVTYTATANR
jgi:hypothetical protein